MHAANSIQQLGPEAFFGDSTKDLTTPCGTVHDAYLTAENVQWLLEQGGLLQQQDNA